MIVVVFSINPSESLETYGCGGAVHLKVQQEIRIK